MRMADGAASDGGLELQSNTSDDDELLLEGNSDDELQLEMNEEELERAPKRVKLEKKQEEAKVELKKEESSDDDHMPDEEGWPQEGPSRLYIPHSRRGGRAQLVSWCAPPPRPRASAAASGAST